MAIKLEKYNEWKKEKSSGQNTENNQSITLSKYHNYKKEKTAKKEINFDTFESDLNALNPTVESIANGWQSEETLTNAYPSIKAMYDRLSAYQNYRGANTNLPDLSGQTNYYKTVLDNWDNIVGTYGDFKSADDYNKALERENSIPTANLDDIQTEINDIDSQIKAVQDEKKKYEKANKVSLPNSHYNRPNASQIQAFTNYNTKISDYNNQINDLETKKAERQSYYNDVYTFKRDAEEKERAKMPEAIKGWEMFLDGQDEHEQEKAEKEKTMNKIRQANLMGSHDGGQWISDLVLVKSQDDSYKMPTDDWTQEEKYIFGSYYYEDLNNGTNKSDEYAIRINKQKGEKKENKAKQKISNSATSSFWSGAGHTGLSFLAMPFAGADYIDNLTSVVAGQPIMEDGFISPFEYGQTVRGAVGESLNDWSGALPESIPVIGGKGIGDVYQLGTSVVDSGISTFTLGPWGTALSFFGQAGASSIDDALSRGATDEQALWYGTINGIAESISEYIGADRLVGINSSHTIQNLFTHSLKNGYGKKFFQLVNKQGLAEGLEEGFSSFAGKVADQWIMKDKSEFNLNVQRYMAEGLSKDEATSKAWVQSINDIAYDVLGGYISGDIHAGISVPVASHKIKAQNETLGGTIREGGKVGDVLDTLAMTPKESETYKAYQRYFGSGITADNVTDAQLGNMYAIADEEARDILSSRKSTLEQRKNATETLKKLSAIQEEGTVDSETIKGIERRNAFEEMKIDYTDKLHRQESDIISEGLENDTDSKAYKLASALKEKVENGGTVSTKELEKLMEANVITAQTQEAVNRAENLPKVEKDLFLKFYDGKTNIEYFSTSFNYVTKAVKDGWGYDYVQQHKGALTDRQVGDIYRTFTENKNKKLEKSMQKIREQFAKAPVGAGTLDDSIINYTNETIKGKVRWNSLHDDQKISILLMSAFALKSGMNIKLVADGEKKNFNGYFKVGENTIYVDVHAGLVTKYGSKSGKSLIIPTLSHEVTHWMEEKVPELYRKYSKYVIDTLKMSGKTEEQLLDEKLERLTRNHPDKKYDADEVRRELVAEASANMFAKSEEIQKMLSSLNENERSQFVQKVKEILHDIKNWLNNFLAEHQTSSQAAKTIEMFQDRIDEQVKLWDKMLKESIEVNKALKMSGTAIEDIIEKDVEAKDLQFNERYIESHMKALDDMYVGGEDSLTLGELKNRYNEVIKIWKELGAEMHSDFLTEWNNSQGTDRTFEVFKAQAGYKYNIELSTMCKKGIALFDAIDQIVKKEVMKKLNTDVLGKAEKEILYDILKLHHFEIPCAICYVEQARQGEGRIIDAFLNGKITKDQFKLGWNETIDRIEKEMKLAGCDYTFTSLDRSVATDNYTPADLSMDEETQNYYFNALTKITNKEIKRYNKEKNKSINLIKANANKIGGKEFVKSVNNSLKGKLPTNLIMLKTMFNEPSSRFRIDGDLLYSSATTLNLATFHQGIYKVFNIQGGTGGYKTKQPPVVYWGDILQKSWSPSDLRKYGGIRNQSNSDFMMYTLLDQAQMYIDFTAKGYYLQAYTKVLAELKLFGLSKAKINASLIPAVVVYKNDDGTVNVEKTMLNAGLDENGNLIFDDIEGINHTEAFMLLEDTEYSKSIGGVCIGYSDNHILKLLDDNRIQLIIGFHDKTNNPDKRYRGAKYSKNYNGVNEATRKSDGKTVHVGFNQFVIRAEGKFKNKDSIVYNGKTYQYNDIPRLAADLYLEHCEKKDLYPAYYMDGKGFTTHPNYYKLLADFSLYDINGNYAPHQKVEFNMPSKVPYLDENGNKAYENTKDYIKKELKGELEVRDNIALALADQSEEGIIPQFIEKVNELHKDEGKQFADREISDLDAEYLELAQNPEKNEARLRELVDEAAKRGGYNSPKLYHGTKQFGYTKFKGTEGFPYSKIQYFATESIETASTYSETYEPRKLSEKKMLDNQEKQEIDEKMVNVANNLASFMSESVGRYGYIDGSYILSAVKGNNDTKEIKILDTWLKNVYKSKYSEKYEDFSEFQGSEYDEQLENKFYNLWEEIKSLHQYVEGHEKSGIYEFVANTDNLFVIEGHGKKWNELEDTRLPERIINDGGKDVSHKYDTRAVCSWAKKQGYNGVLFKNIIDSAKGENLTPANVYAFFDPRKQVKSADIVTYDKKGNIIPLSKRFKQNNSDMRYADREISDIDTEYLELAKNPERNKVRLREMVDEAARKGGFPIRAYHGSNSFGFNIFNSRKSDDGISHFFTDNIEVAKSYMEEEYEESGIYDVYLKMENPLIIDTKNSNWEEIEFVPPELETLRKEHEDAWEKYDEQDNKVEEYAELKGISKSEAKEELGIDDTLSDKAWALEFKLDDLEQEYGFGSMSTREITRYAYKNKYNGVTFKNLYDSGPYSTNDNITSTVYAVFNTKHIKSADLVTYDDEGNIIPLSKRFNTEETDIRYADRETSSVYEMMGELEKLRKENENFREDVARLQERLKLEKEVTGGKVLNENQLGIVAGQIRQIANSTFDKKELVNRLRDFYGYIMSGEEFSWDDIFEEAYSIAEEVLKDSKQPKHTNKYYQTIMHDIRNSRISFSEEQKREFEYTHGANWHKAFFGKLNVANDGVPLDTKWKEWSSMYPDIFKEDVNALDQANELYEIYDALKEGMEIYEEYDKEEMTRWLAYEIYDRFWRVNNVTTTADKYDKQIKRLNYEHRNAMAEMRDKHNKQMEDQKLADTMHYGKMIAEERRKKDEALEEASKEHRESMSKLRNEKNKKLEEQKLADEMHYGKLIEKIKKRNEESLAEAKRLGKERLDSYKENAERKTKIQAITSKVLTLNRWMLKNNKEEHIPDVLKDPVKSLIEAIDFSSKRALYMTDGKLKGVPTQKDISLEKALRQVKDMMVKANTGVDSLMELYGNDMDEKLETLLKSVENTTKNLGDNEFILNAMSLEELKVVDELVTTVKSAVSKLNEFYTVQHKKGVADLGESSYSYLKGLGDKNENQFTVGAKNFLHWRNIEPIFAFKRFGEGGRKIFEAFQDGFDKLAFNLRDVIEFTKSAYKGEDVRKWEKEIHEFNIPQPSADPNKIEYKKLEMTTAHLMSLYCLWHRKEGKAHILGGGVLVEKFVAEKGRIGGNVEAVHLDETEIKKMLKELSPEAEAVAKKLQKFMTTVVASWGNEIFMKRFGITKFNDPTYFPIFVDSNTTSGANNGEQPAESNGNANMFKILNISSAKDLIPNANNTLVIRNIFDAFAEHTSDMAKFNALALPILDGFRWYNYKRRENIDDTKHDSISVRGAIASAYGTEAKEYIRKYIEDINGTASSEKFGLVEKAFRNAKIANIGFSLSVALLQPTSYLKAIANAKVKYLSKALVYTANPKIRKKAIERSKKYCGMACWKSLDNFYDTNISRNMVKVIKNADSLGEKYVSASMKLPGKFDEATFGTLWIASELEIRDTRKDLKVGSEEFYNAIAKRLREIIYTTQVVDSPMTRSQLMRSNQTHHKILTMYASELTKSYNMVVDAFSDMHLDARELETKSLNKKIIEKNGEKLTKAEKKEAKNSSKKEAWKKNRKKIGRVISAYVVTSTLVALLESGFTWYRDDDDEEMDLAEFMKIYLTHFAEEMSFIGKIPYLKDIISLAQGYSMSRSEFAWAESMIKMVNSFKKHLNGEGGVDKTIKNTLQFFSYVTGKPFYTPYRELMAGLDSFHLLTAEDFREMLDDFFNLD